MFEEVNPNPKKSLDFDLNRTVDLPDELDWVKSPVTFRGKFAGKIDAILRVDGPKTARELCVCMYRRYDIIMTQTQMVGALNNMLKNKVISLKGGSVLSGTISAQN